MASWTDLMSLLRPQSRGVMPQSGPDGGNPFDDGAPQGGPPPPAAPPQGGVIRGPSFDEASGPYGESAVPTGFLRYPFMPGYYVNPATGEVGRATITGRDLDGLPKVSFETLSEAERNRFLDQYGGLLDTEAGSSLLGGGGAAGGGGMTASEAGNLSARQAELAQKDEQDRVANAMAVLKAIADQRDVEDVRQSAAQKALLDALPYSTRDRYFPGFGPGQTMGLVPVTAVQGVPFDPASAGKNNAYDQQVADQLAKVMAMRGAA